MSLQPPPFSAAFSLGLSFSVRLVLSNEPLLEFGADQEPEKNVFEGVTYVVSDNWLKQDGWHARVYTYSLVLI